MRIPRIIYVAGTRHSGSTLLDMLMSTHSQVIGIGEAKMFALRPHTNCTCGADHWQTCPFWTGVDERMRSDNGPGIGYADIESHDPETFSAYNARFFRAIGEEGKFPVVLDSSKDFTRLASLLASDLPVEVVHLVRDPRGVVFSGIRKKRPIGAVCRRYVRTNVASAYLLRDKPHVEVRYEDLARHPERELARILDLVGLDIEHEQLADWRNVERHNFAGNRMRTGGSKKIRPHEAWRTDLSAWQRLTIPTRTLPARVRSRIGMTLLHRWLLSEEHYADRYRW